MARQSHAMTMRLAFVFSISTLLLLASDVEAATEYLLGRKTKSGWILLTDQAWLDRYRVFHLGSISGLVE